MKLGYYPQDQYTYIDRMSRSPYYNGSHHSSMESLASQDSIQQVNWNYRLSFHFGNDYYIYDNIYTVRVSFVFYD